MSEISFIMSVIALVLATVAAAAVFMVV